MDKYDTLPVCHKCECPDCRWKPMAELAMPICTHGPNCVMKLKSQMETKIEFVHVHLFNWKGFHLWTTKHKQI